MFWSREIFYRRFKFSIQLILMMLSVKQIYHLGNVLPSGSELESAMFPREIEKVTKNRYGYVAILMKETFDLKLIDAAAKVSGFYTVKDEEHNEIAVYTKEPNSEISCGCGVAGPPHNEENGFLGTYWDKYPVQILLQRRSDFDDLKIVDNYLKLKNDDYARSTRPLKEKMKSLFNF